MSRLYNFCAGPAALPAPVLERVAAVCPVLEPAETLRAMEQGPVIYRHYFRRRWTRTGRFARISSYIATISSESPTSSA